MVLKESGSPSFFNYHSMKREFIGIGRELCVRPSSTYAKFSEKPFLDSLKTSENLTVFWCFQGVEKGYIGNKWVKKYRYIWYGKMFFGFSVAGLTRLNSVYSDNPRFSTLSGQQNVGFQLSHVGLVNILIIIAMHLLRLFNFLTHAVFQFVFRRLSWEMQRAMLLFPINWYHYLLYVKGLHLQNICRWCFSIFEN